MSEFNEFVYFIFVIPTSGYTQLSRKLFHKFIYTKFFIITSNLTKIKLYSLVLYSKIIALLEVY